MTTTARTRKAGARERLVAAAERVFLTNGIRAVGVDRLCAEAEVSKRSLYQHFSGKDEVVTAMLQAQAAKFSAGLAADDQPPRERILAAFAPFEGDAPKTELAGCPFVGAATELKDPQHPAARVAREQKVALTAYFAELARAGGATDPDLLALQLTLVFDGASAFFVVRGESTSATRVTVETLLAAHGM